MSDTPFDSVEGAHEYVGLLLDALREARVEVEQDLTAARTDGAPRRMEALQLVAWKLERLELHLGSSRHLLNDLRRLRDLLLAEPAPGTEREPRPAPDDPWEEP